MADFDPKNAKPDVFHEFDRVKSKECARQGDFKRHECYKNAAMAAIGDALYYEGVVIVHGVPIEHAWIVKQDAVIDPTCALDDFVGVEKYVGFRVPDHMRLALKTGRWGPYLTHKQTSSIYGKVIGWRPRK